MLRFNFTRVFIARGIDKPFSFLVNSGYSGNFSTRIANNRVEKLNLREVEKLCEILQCTPNDLLVWYPDKNEETNDQHPLVSLRRSDKVVQLTKILNNIPLNKLKDIEDLISAELKKQNDT